MNGKRIRMRRLTDRVTGNAVIIPMDHGVTMGPIDGLRDIDATVRDVTGGDATAVLMQKGLMNHCHVDPGVGVIMHISASTDLGGSGKVLVSSVDEALRLGCDAVSMHVTFGGSDEGDMLTDLGRIAEDCEVWGMPLMVMAYHSDPSKMYDPDVLAHCARAATELGADIIKVPYTGDATSFRKVTEGTPAPVLIAGGPKILSDLDVLTMVRDSMDAGGRGVSIGRNIFQHADVKRMTSAVKMIVVDDASVDDAYGYLRE